MRTSRRPLPLLVTGALVLVVTAAPGVAEPADGAVPAVSYGAVPAVSHNAVPAVSYQDVLPHLEQFQQIADHNGGNRAHGTPGFDASLAYVKAKLDAAGFRTRVESFEHDGKAGHNLIADWPGGDAGNALLLGAHLDSVPEGPGLNDNASGSAALLTTALKVAEQRLEPGKHLRFAWWGAEESGLVGSRHHVAQQSDADLSKIDAYLNFDMAGTADPPHYFLTDSGNPATAVLREFLNARGMATFEVGGGEGSDHAPFAERGVPIAGFATGLDDCYHDSCDTLANVDPATETLSTNAMIDATWRLAEPRSSGAQAPETRQTGAQQAGAQQTRAQQAGTQQTGAAQRASAGQDGSRSGNGTDLSGAGDPYYPDDGNAGYDVEHYDLQLDYDPANPDRLTGEATITATATQDLTRFNLDLIGFDITGSAVDGKPAANRREGAHELVLTPQQPIREGERFTAKVNYTGQPTGEDWHRIDGGGFAAYGSPHPAMSWFPANDHPSDKATLSLAATVPDGWQVMGNGEPGETTRADGRSTFRWHEDQQMATYTSGVSVDKFTVHTGTLSDGRPAIYGWGSGTQIMPDSERIGGEIIDAFSELFGPYPANSAGGIVVDSDGHPAMETQSRPTYSGVMFDSNMAHELSHMWFGNAVSPADWRSGCIKECIAQYANQLWEEHKGANLDTGFYQGMVEDNRDDPEFWNTRLYDPGPGKELDPALYSKGSMMMHALRKAIGDPSFFTLLQSWVREHRGGNASWPQFEQMAQQVSGQDLRGFFDAWAHSTTVPEQRYLFPAGR